jgi:hypothetical protein
MPVMWVPDQPRHEKVSETLSHKNKLGARVVAHILIPTTWAVEVWRTMVQGQLGQKVSETTSQPISWAWWYVPVIPAT